MRKAEVDGQVGYYDEETEDFYPEGTLKKAEIEGKTGLYNPETEDFFPLDFAGQPAPTPKPTRWQDTFTSAIKKAFEPDPNYREGSAFSAQPGAVMSEAEMAAAAGSGLDTAMRGAGIVAKGAKQIPETLGRTAANIGRAVGEIERGLTPEGVPNAIVGFGDVAADSAATYDAILKEREQRDTAGLSDNEKILYGAPASIAANVPSLAAGVVTGGVAPALTVMGIGKAADRLAEFRDAGKSLPVSIVGAGLSAGAEVVPEAIPMGWLLSKGTPAIKAVAKYVLGEQAQEQITTFSDNLIDWAIKRPDMKLAEWIDKVQLPSMVQTAKATMVQAPVTGALARGGMKLLDRGQGAAIPPAPRNLDEYIAQKIQPRSATPAPVAPVVPGQPSTQPVVEKGLESPASELGQNEPVVAQNEPVANEAFPGAGMTHDDIFALDPDGPEMQRPGIAGYRLKHDALTGLKNRAEFFRKLDARGDNDTTVFQFDLDKFKAVNDFFGHEAGDTVLREIGTAVKSLGLGDYIHRTGGEEFEGVGFKDEAQAKKSIDRLTKYLADRKIEFKDMETGETLEWEGVPFSHGIATGKGREARKNADAALKQSKLERAGLGFRPEGVELSPLVNLSPQTERLYYERRKAEAERKANDLRAGTGELPGRVDPWAKGDKFAVAPIHAKDFSYLRDLYRSIRSITPTGKAVRDASAEPGQGEVVGRSRSGLPAHLESVGIVQGDADTIGKILKGVPVTKKQYQSVDRILKIHKEGLGHGENITSIETELVPGESLNAGDVFYQGGSYRQVIDVAPWDNTITVDDGSGSTMTFSSNEQIEIDKGSVERYKPESDIGLMPFEEAGGVAEKPEVRYTGKHELSATRREDTPGRQAGTEAGRVSDAGGTPAAGEFQLTPQESTVRKPAPKQQGLTLGMTGKDLRAPERQNLPLTETPLEKSARESKAREAQPGLFDELKKSESGIQQIGNPKVEVVSEVIGHYESNVTQISGPADVAQMVQEIGRSPQEKFVMVIADGDGRAISILNYSMGSHTASIVHPMAMGRVLQVPGAKQVWFAHNHPSGDTKPSREDILLTTRLSNVLKNSPVKYKGHVIVGNGEWSNLSTDGEFSVVTGENSAEKVGESQRIPIVERRVKTQDKERGESIVTSEGFAEFAEKAIPDGGIVLMDTKNRAIVLLTLPEDITRMDGPIFTTLLQEIEKANASSILVYSPKREMQPYEVTALKSFSELVGTPLLDVADKNLSVGAGKKYRSWRDMGKISESLDTPYSGVSDKVLSGLILKASPNSRNAFAKVFELGKRVYESGKTKYSEFEFTMHKKMGAAWGKLKGMVRKAWDRLVAINEKMGQSGHVGEKSNLNAFQRKQVASPEFKAWFKDSKVVDENGDPLVVYHGTTQTDITKFLPNGGDIELGKKTLALFRKATKNNTTFGYMNFRSGTFFSPDPEYAGHYTAENTGLMYPVYIKAENPVYFDHKATPKARILNPGKTADALFMMDGDKINEVAVIEPTQVKSASANAGAFDSNNPVITASFPAGPIIQAIRAAKDAKAAYPHLVKLGQRVMLDGKTKFADFQSGMKSYIGDLWQKFKSRMMDIYFAAKAANKKLGSAGLFVGPKGSKAFAEQRWGKFSDLADRQERFEISDEGAKIINKQEAAWEAMMIEQGNIRRANPGKSVADVMNDNPELAEEYKRKSDEYQRKIGNTVLSDYFEHPAIYAQYPWLADVKIKMLSHAMGGASGGYNELENTIYLDAEKYYKDPDVKDFKATLLHEVQHAIQEHEGFAQGGTPRTAKGDAMLMAETELGKLLHKEYGSQQFNRDIQKLQDKYLKGDAYQKNAGVPKSQVSAYNDAVDRYKEGVKYRVLKANPQLKEKFKGQELSDFDYYRRLAGEEESRRVSARANMTAAERMGTPYEKSDLAPGEERIVRMGGGISQSVTIAEWMKAVEAAVAAGKKVPASVIEDYLKRGGSAEKVGRKVPRGTESGAPPPTKYIPVSTEKAPDSNTKESKLAVRAESDAIKAKLTEDFGDLSEYRTMNMQEQADKAQAIMAADYEAAKRMAMGEELPPQGVREATMYEAVKIRALKEGDTETLYNLAVNSTVPTRLSEYGQAIKAADSRLMDDPVKVMQEVIRGREERAKRTGKDPVSIAKIESLTKELNEVTERLRAHEEAASKKQADAKIHEIKKQIFREAKRASRSASKSVLDEEFAGLSRQLSGILKPGTLNMSIGAIDPTAIPVLVAMAKNRLKAGLLHTEGVISSIYEEVKKILPDVTKRNVRDAISEYGKQAHMSKDEIDVRLRELKRQARLISALEDAKAGQAPLRSGLTRDEVTDEVRALTKEVKQAMRNSGIDSETTRSPEQQYKTALDAVKTRLRNQIHDINKQLETGQKTPKNKGIEYDAEANALKAERDKVRAMLRDVEGKPEMSPEQRVRVATASVERSIAELERRIAEHDLVRAKKESKTPVTPELSRLRSLRDGLRVQFKEMQDAAKAPKDPAAIRLKTFKTRTANEIARLEKKLADGDFVTVEKAAPAELDAEGKRLKAAREIAKENYHAAMDASRTVTKEEAAEIVRLSKVTEDARKVMEQGGDRFEYGAARVAYENYVNDLKRTNAPIKELIKDRIGEFKTTWKDNKSRAAWELQKDAIKTITDNSIAMVASLDNSFLGRQGLKTLMTHPSAWWPGAKNSFLDFAKTLGGKETQDALNADIYSRPNYVNGEYLKAKIITKTEEQYPDTLPERIPVVGRIFKASEVAFTGSALRMRTDLYDMLSAKAKENGAEMDKKQIEDIGKLINSLTARGKWGERGESPVVRLILWAPKMLKGNIDVLTAHNFGAGLETDFARKEAALNLLKIVSITAILMAIANALKPDSAELDPRSSDFGKIKVGTTRFDITGGAASIVVLAARIIPGLWGDAASKSTTTGLVVPYGLGYGKRSPFDALIDFVNNKTTPAASVVSSWLKGKNRDNEPWTVGDAAYRAFTPISLQNTIKLKDDASADKVAGALVDFIGINANSYGDSSTQRGDIVDKMRAGKPLNKEQQEAFNAMSEEKQGNIKRESKLTTMQAGIKKLTIEEALYAWSKASEKDRQEIRETLIKKINNSKKTEDEKKSYLVEMGIKNIDEFDEEDEE